MKTEEIVVTIAPDGSVQIVVTGFTGMSCRTATADLEAKLGNAVLERTMSEEAYLAEQSGATINQGGSW